MDRDSRSRDEDAGGWTNGARDSADRESAAEERSKRQAAATSSDDMDARTPAWLTSSRAPLVGILGGEPWDAGLEDTPAKARKGSAVPEPAAKATDRELPQAHPPPVQRKAAAQASPAGHDGATAADRQAFAAPYAPGPLPRLVFRGTKPAVFVPAKSLPGPAVQRKIADITPPTPGIDKPGFIDNSDGSYIRTAPREAGGQPVRDEPLPPATRVFVSGTHPSAPAWWYVTAYLADRDMVRGYVQRDRVNMELPEPLAELRQLVGGETAEGLAKEKFGGAVTDGHDLRYYENVLLYVNQSRAGIRGTYQDPGVLGGGSNHAQLVAGHRIWLVSAEYAKALQSVVPSGSLTGGAVAKVKRFAGHLQDILHSVTESPNHFGEVAGEFAQAIRDHLPEIVGITAGFLMAEATSMFLAAAPTGVSQAAAAVIQLALAAFGASGMVQASLEALKHGAAWLTTAWTAHGKPERIAEASREFLRMLVAVAMAALSYLGAKSNYGNALKIARSMPTTGPALALAGGGEVSTAGAGTGIALGGPGFAGPVGTTGAMMTKHEPEGGAGSPEETGHSKSHSAESEPAAATLDHTAAPADSTYRETFFAAHPELRGQVVVHHAIEQQVLRRYPGLFTEAEIHALENLRGIPKNTNPDLHLSQIRKAWNEFYRTNTNPTKQQVLDFARNSTNNMGRPSSRPDSGIQMTTTYWRMSPEVAGELAEGTQMDTTVHPPRVTRLHHRLEGWLGDDIVECFPCFLVTERLAKPLESSGLTGFQLDDVETSKSPEFREMYPDRQLPNFRWLKVTAVQPKEADFRLTHDHQLEVSDAALALLRTVQIDHADLEKAYG